MNTNTSFHSFYDDIIITKISGLGSCISGGSSWGVGHLLFRTKKQCLEYIHSLDNEPKTKANLQAKAVEMTEKFPRIFNNLPRNSRK